MAMVKGFITSSFNDDLFKQILCSLEPEAKLESWKRIQMDTAHGIIADLAPADIKAQQVIGLHAFKLTYKVPYSPDEQLKNVVIKSKARGDDVLAMIVDIVSKMNDDELLQNYLRFVSDMGLSNMDQRELQSVQLQNVCVNVIQPTLYWSLVDAENDVFIFAMEYFNKKNFTHMDSVDNISIWKEADIIDAINGIAKLHGRYYGRISDIPVSLSKWMNSFNKASINKVKPLLRSLLEHNHRCIADIWDNTAYSVLDKALVNLDKVFDVIDQGPLTLIHNDFNLRNMCLRKESTDNKHRLCLYDWECAWIGAPQRDVAEFLLFVLPNNTDVEIWHKYVNAHLKSLRKEIVMSGSEELCGSFEDSLTFDRFLRVFDMSVLDLLTNRLATYGPTHRTFTFTYLPRVILNGIQYIQARQKEYTFLE